LLMLALINAAFNGKSCSTDRLYTPPLRAALASHRGAGAESKPCNFLQGSCCLCICPDPNRFETMHACALMDVWGYKLNPSMLGSTTHLNFICASNRRLGRKTEPSS